MKPFGLIFFFISVLLSAYSQKRTVIVPQKLMVCGMEVVVKESGKTAILEIAKPILDNEKYFQTKLERISLHMPLVEKVLKEEGVPSDFKYLCMMESSLQADAVSTSNAVGYWQFKKESAQEVGLRVDNQVDERKNLISSTQGAARYLKKNYKVLNNWIFTTLSYNLGLSGVQRSVDKSQLAANSYTLDGQSPRYLQKFVAYKLIFEQHQLDKPLELELKLYDYGKESNVERIATELKLETSVLLEHNKWILTNQIPSDKLYPLFYLSCKGSSSEKVLVDDSGKEQVLDTVPKKEEPTSIIKKIWHVFTGDHEPHEVPVIVQINGLNAIQARKGDNAHKLALQADIRYKKFLKYNELRSFDELIPGMFYYLESKKSEATVLFHVVRPNETIWTISQLYGIETDAIIRKNRMKDGEALVVGRKLYLKEYRPIEEPILVEKEIVEEVMVVPNSVMVEKKEKSDTLKPQIETKEEDTSQKVNPTKVNPGFHQVAQGESLYKLSKQYELSVDSLVKWNRLEGYAINPGMKLRLSPPDNETANQLYKEYVVKQGDSIYRISRENNLSVSELLKINSKLSNELKVGEVLKIPVKE